MSALEGLRILVVGGAGFVGSNLVRRALSGGALQAVVVDNLLSSEADSLPADERIEIRVGSIADEAVLAEIGDEFDTVFHLATYHGNQSSIANPLADHENNLLTTLKLFDHLARLERPPRVVYASTGCALASKQRGPAEPVAEDGPVPLDYDSPYQISKLAGEMYALYYGQQHGLPVVRARFQNVYGPGEILGAGQWRGTPATVWRNVVPTFVYRALKAMPLKLHGDGLATRDFVYVDDVVEGLVRCARTDRAAGEVFNLAAGEETTIRALAETVNALAGGRSAIELIPARDWDRSINRCGSTAKSEKVLGFRATTTLDAGLTHTVAWTRANLARIEACIARHAQHLDGDEAV